MVPDLENIKRGIKPWYSKFSIGEDTVMEENDDHFSAEIDSSGEMQNILYFFK